MEKKLKVCRECGQSSLDVSFLGKNPETGNKIFSITCYLGCTDYLKTILPNGKVIKTNLI